MKKIIIGIMILLIPFLTGCNKGITYTGLSYEKLNQKLENKESFVLVIGSSTCPSCISYKEVINKTKTGTKLTMFYINIDYLSEDEYAKLNSKYTFDRTPTTIFIKDGDETSTYDRIIGQVDSSELLSQLKKHGYIGD